MVLAGRLRASPSPAGTCTSPNRSPAGCRSTRAPAPRLGCSTNGARATANPTIPARHRHRPEHAATCTSQTSATDRVQEFSSAGAFIAAFGSQGLRQPGSSLAPRAWPSAPPAPSSSPTARITASRNGWPRKSQANPPPTPPASPTQNQANSANRTRSLSTPAATSGRPAATTRCSSSTQNTNT